jgi:3-phosphoshikimate 1-carboxyvinyltransferase
MKQLGVDGELGTASLNIYGKGWVKPQSPVLIHREQSSQFASSLLLNCWNLDFPVEFDLRGAGVSEGYWKMSVAVAEQLGMKIESNRSHFMVPAQQKVLAPQMTAEVDYSSAFAVAAAAALGGEAEILNCDPNTNQPDFIFIDALKKLGVPVSLQNHHLKVSKAKEMTGVEIDLSSAPDLFPILAVLCAFANKSSKLHGAPQLALKESNRIKKTYELLKAMGVQGQELPDGLLIQGLPADWKPDAFVFDPDQDHRMAMAAGLLKLRDFPVTILHPEVVAKSFPEFWKILGIRP